ncbi:MAG: hypothetical protein ABIQ89_03740 [Candidatus Saccharimonadales bacterium]
MAESAILVVRTSVDAAEPRHFYELLAVRLHAELEKDPHEVSTRGFNYPVDPVAQAEARAESMIRMYGHLRAGSNVVYNSHVMKEADRAPLKGMAGEIGCRMLILGFNTPVDLIMDRINNRYDDYPEYVGNDPRETVLSNTVIARMNTEEPRPSPLTNSVKVFNGHLDASGTATAVAKYARTQLSPWEDC